MIDQCHRKAILLPPEILFKLIGKDSPDRELFNLFADRCPCDCRNLMSDMEQDIAFKPLLFDGSFNGAFPTDLGLSAKLDNFIPLMGVSRPTINGRAIIITIRRRPDKDMKEIEQGLQKTKPEEKNEKAQDIKKEAKEAADQFRRTYAQYVLSFALRNSPDTRALAMQKLARHRR